MKEILAATGVISLIVMGLTQMAKQELPNSKHLPVINLVIGIFIGLLYGWSMDGNLITYGWAGLVAGMAAGGFYDLGTTYLKKDGE